MLDTDTGVQLRSRRSRATRALSMARKRRVKGATDQRKITLPMHVWTLLEEACLLHTEAYRVNAAELGVKRGSTTYSVSDGIETGVALFLNSLREDFGPMPTEESSKSEREAWVKRLAAQIKKDVIEDYWAKKSH